jgi:FkbM family methyltransferase
LSFADNDPQKWGAKVDGLPVCSRREAVDRWGGSAAFVVTVYNGAPVREQLRMDGCSAVVPAAYLCYKHAETFLPLGGISRAECTLNHATDIRCAAKVWGDEWSRNLFLSQLRFRLTLDSSVLPAHSPPAETYFPPEIASKGDDLFVDCGAFDGDSVEAFLSRDLHGGARAIAIEPDPSNFASLAKRLERRGWTGRVSTHNVAVSSEPGSARFHATASAGSALGVGGELSVPSVRLDDLLAEAPVSYLKMDIEGAEQDALRGAVGVLKARRPVLAICLYHKPEDLWEIPLFVDSLGCGYKLLLRAYAEDCWELVLYAIPPEREVSHGG